MHGPIFNRRGDQVGYVEGDWALDRWGQKRFMVDGAKLLHPATLEIVGYLTDVGKISSPDDNGDQQRDHNPTDGRQADDAM
jgi:hypothetical protein